MNARHLAASGFTLLEVLITIIILAIGLLGLASLQSKTQLAQVESYQRAQAVLLLEDMLGRINANRGGAVDYVTGPDNPVGTDGNPPAACPGGNNLNAANLAARDLCEWSNALKGASEVSDGGASPVGAMIGARGCVEQVQKEDGSPGVCQPGIYRVTVVWQGLTATSAPILECAKNLNAYGDDANRRAISAQTVIGLNDCS